MIWISQINTIINVDHISDGKITSPSKRGIVSDLVNETLNASMTAEVIFKASAVAPDAILYQVHVNSTPHVVVAAFCWYHDSSSNGLTRLSKGASHIHLGKVDI